MIRRTGAAALLALGVTFGLFYLMQALIAPRRDPPEESGDRIVVDFVRVERESELELKSRKLPEKQPAQRPPPPLDLDLAAARTPAGGPTAGPTFDLEVDVDVDLGGPDLSTEIRDREAIPLVRVAPRYPERAARRGIEGWVLIGFTITEDGGVRSPVVLDAEPRGVFERAALRAVRKFKFRPRLENGVPVAQPNQKISIQFGLAEE
ncbi:MAG: TonB family protein [Myxococcota bacterium]